MGLFNFFRPRDGTWHVNDSIEVSELFECAEEFAARKLAFDVCVNMVASAIGRCEFRTYEDGVEVKDAEYYLWNVEPNTNQNSTDFLHKLVTKLCVHNEALIINTRKRDGTNMIVIADEWTGGNEYPARMNEYKQVTVGSMTYDKTFRENEVLHLRHNFKNIAPVIKGLADSYSRLIQLAERAYTEERGHKYKVHVEQVASGQNDFEDRFQKILENQIKPYFNATDAVLLETSGYTYTDVTRSLGRAPANSDDIRALYTDLFNYTARAFLIPTVLVEGKVEATTDANQRFLTSVIDPICDQLQEEIVRKRYGFDEWKRGTTLVVDSSSILHYDIFAQAMSVEKLIGSGVYTINDVLKSVGQPTINAKWANSHYMTLNIGTMDENAKSLEGGEQ